jgi:hypothetical protein
MGLLIPISVAGVTFLAPRVYSYFWPQGLESPQTDAIRKFFVVDCHRERPNDPIEEAAINSARNNFKKMENFFLKIYSIGYYLRTKIDQIGVYHFQIHHFVTTVLRDNLWVSALTISLLWEKGMLAAVNPYLALGLLGVVGIPLCSYSLHGARLLAKTYLPEKYGSFFAPSLSPISEKYRQINFLLSRVLPFLKEAGITANGIWNVLYTHLFDDKEHFDSYLETFESNIEKILPFLLQQFPQLKNDQLCQLFLAKDEIPEFLHEDAFLIEYCCTISHSPVRIPMKDMSNGASHHLYEKAMILNWLQQHHTNPTTRKPATINDFVLDVDLKRQIDARLFFLRGNLLRERISLPIERDLVFIDHMFIFIHFCESYKKEQEHIQQEAGESIPEDLHTDPFFIENTCPITQLPIRHPLRNPITGMIYEAKAIKQWVRERGVSPSTLTPLKLEDLQPVPELEEEIERRLRLHHVI